MPTLVQRPPAGSTATTANAPRKRRKLSRWKVAVAVLAALLLHAALIVLLAWALPHWPRPPIRKGTPPAPIQLTIQSADPTPPPPGLHKTETVQPPPEYIRTPDNLKSDTPPPDPKFISSQDTQAQSEKPPEDMTKPLPTQDGLERPAFEFETNPYIPGKEAHDLLASAAPASQPAPTPPPVNPTPAPQESPTPPPTSKPTPPPQPDSFSIQRPDASPSNTPPEPSPIPTPRPTVSVKDALAAQADRVARENPSISSNGVRQPPGYQPQTNQTKMNGSVDNLGKSSVSARGTPLGRYEKAVSDAIGARWYFNVDQNMSNLVRTGEVKIHFVVTRAGKIINTRVDGKNQNTTLADISLEAVVNAELPPIPADVAAILPGGQLEVDYTFGMFEH